MRLIPAIMAAALFNDAINGQVLETGTLGKSLAVGRFTDARGTGNNDVGILPCHIAQPSANLGAIDCCHL